MKCPGSSDACGYEPLCLDSGSCSEAVARCWAWVPTSLTWSQRNQLLDHLVATTEPNAQLSEVS